ncbi:MAG: hypothetical protein KAI79_09575 [Bacteroidales bacterium]|nr:hypothetical protein [Bacteroidales bacterium]
MDQIISFITFGVFAISIVWFCDYILNLHMHKKYPFSVDLFFRTSLRTKGLVKFSHVYKNFASEEKLSLWFTKDNEEDIYKVPRDIIVDDKDILTLHLMFNNNNEPGKAIISPVDYDKKFHTNTLKPQVTYIPSLIIDTNLGMLTLSGIRIGKLVIKKNIKTFFTIKNCWIHSVEFDNMYNKNAPDLMISHSYIGIFDLENGKVGNISFNNCMIDYFKTPLKYEKSPIEGDAQFINTSFIGRHSSIGGHVSIFYLQQLHYLRNLRMILDNSSNKRASRYILGYEKRIQRNELKNTAKLIDYLYDSMSFYNNIPERVLGSIGFILLIMYSFLLVANISIIEKDTVINNISVWALQMKNSFLFLLQSISSPMVTLNGKGKFILESMTLNVVYSFLSIIVLLLIALYIFGLKRKYQD